MGRKYLKLYIPFLSLMVFCSVLLLHLDSESQQANNSYAGSKSCEKCHTAYYSDWNNTLHAKMEREVISEGPDKNVLGDFTTDNPLVTHKLEDIDMVIGSRFKQRYTKKIGDDYFMLPFQWNVAAERWVKYDPKNDWWAAEGIYPKGWQNRPHSTLCGGCHGTGFDPKLTEPVEINIGCEACHGPGKLHNLKPEKANIINPIRLSQEKGNMICFQCHMSGRPPNGQFEKYAWPAGYKAGEDLKKYWNYAKPTGKNMYELWADGFAHKNRVQGNTFIRSKMYAKGLNCYTCHDAHGSRNRSLTIKSAYDNSLCLTCHGEKTPQAVFSVSLSQHTQHEADSPGSICIECHMPKTGKNAEKWDARDHSFKFISPLSTINYGTPNGCNNCHEDKTVEWALKEVNQWKFK